MALSEDLTKLATRAKDAEDHFARARDVAQVELEREVASARESAEKHGAKLRDTAEKSKSDVSRGLSSVQKSWNDHLSRVRGDIEAKKAEHSVHSAQRRADAAEDYASFAVDLAYSAVVEAEYAALDAALARIDADEMSEKPVTTGAAGSTS